MAKITKIAQRSLMGAAALAAMTGSVQAQNVTIYGIVDVGVEYVSKVDGDDSVVKLQNGGILPSIWGFRGSEDLGGGLKAVFNLEGDFGGDTGGSRGLGNISQIFGRQANVGLSGGWGTVLMGRQYAPALLAELGTEPRGYKESFSSLLPYALSQLPANNTGLIDAGPNGLAIFTSNMISYTGTFGPVTARLGYGFGEVVDEMGDNSTISLGLTYSGPITVSATYQRIEGLSGTDAESKRFGLGVAVPFGDMTVKAFYSNTEDDNNALVGALDMDLFGIGLDWKWNASNTLTVAYYMAENDEGTNDETWDLVISNDHALSKRTTLYVQLVHSDFDDGASGITSIAADRYSGIQDESSTIFSIGLKHSF